MVSIKPEEVYGFEQANNAFILHVLLRDFSLFIISEKFTLGIKSIKYLHPEFNFFANQHQ